MNGSNLIISHHHQLVGRGDDDHTQYLLTDGSRDLGGDWSLAGNNLTNLDELHATADLLVKPDSQILDGIRLSVLNDETYIGPIRNANKLIFGTETDLGAIFALDGFEGFRASFRIFPFGNEGDPYGGAGPIFPGIIQWDSTLETDFPSGSFGGFINLIGIYRQLQSGFVFSNGVIVNNQIIFENLSGAAADFGPIFGWVDQPTIRSTGGARSMTIYNTTRSQPKFGPHLGGGTLTINNVTQYESTGTVAVGSAIAEWRCFRAAGVSTGGGTIANWFGLDIINPSTVVPTNAYGIRSTMAAGTGIKRFISHEGDAPSMFAGPVELRSDLYFEEDGSGLYFGEISVDDNYTGQTALTTINQWYQVTVFARNGHANGVTPDYTENHILIEHSGFYLITVSASASSTGGGSNVYEAGVWANNGTLDAPNVHWKREMSGGGGDTGSTSMSGIVKLTVGDTIELWARCTTAGSTSLIFQDISMSLVEIGGWAT